jgi:hypothetical protein
MSLISLRFAVCFLYCQQKNIFKIHNKFKHLSFVRIIFGIFSVFLCSRRNSGQLALTAANGPESSLVNCMAGSRNLE